MPTCLRLRHRAPHLPPPPPPRCVRYFSSAIRPASTAQPAISLLLNPQASHTSSYSRCTPGFLPSQDHKVFARHNTNSARSRISKIFLNNTNKSATAIAAKQATKQAAPAAKQVAEKAAKKAAEEEVVNTAKGAAVEQAKAEDAVPSKAEHAAPSKSAHQAGGAAVRI